MAKDGLTEDEVNSADQFFKNMIESSSKIWEEMEKIPFFAELFKGSAQSPQGITGGIKGITEETASLIAGQFFAMRELNQKTYDLLFEQKPLLLNLGYLKLSYEVQKAQYQTGIEQLDVINQSVTHLAQIASNTVHNKELLVISKEIKDMNNYLKNTV